MVLIWQNSLVKSQSKSVTIELLAKTNTLNKSGTINYNKNGVKDALGLESVTEKFIDNFILQVVVPAYNTKENKFVYVGSLNKSIRELLDLSDLPKCNVKAIGFSKANSLPPTYMIEAIPFKQREVEVSNYFLQEYKIATPNHKYEDVMQFIRSKSYEPLGLFLKDFDVTMDFAGSFEKDEVVEYLVKECDFRVQGDEDLSISPRTILDNDKFVGRNCLTYVEEIQGFITRQKIYNKMVQMLESQSVRSSVGCHWKDWVTQIDTRLATARDIATTRGLTRAEVTFYVDDKTSLPSDNDIELILLGIVDYIPDKLVYSTPFKETWLTYCSCFNHSLIVVDRAQNIGLLVYSFNQVTHKLSGQYINDFESKELWVTERLTFNGNLPIDVIEMHVVEKDESVKPINLQLDIICNRYFKTYPDKSNEFTTRIVSQKGVYSHVNASNEELDKMLLTAGLVPHKNCIPHVANTKANNKSKVRVQLHLVDTPTVALPMHSLLKKQSPTDIDTQVELEVQKIEKDKKEFLDELDSCHDKIAQFDNFVEAFKQSKSTTLSNLFSMDYPVLAARCHGKRYRLLLEYNETKLNVWSNWQLGQDIDKFIQRDDVKDKLYDSTSGYIFSLNDKLATLTVRGKAINEWGNWTVYTSIKFTESLTDVNEGYNTRSKSLEKANALQDQLTEIVPENRNNNDDGDAIPIKVVEDLQHYPLNPSLTFLPVLTIKLVSAIGWVSYRGKERLLVEVDGTMYQAGTDLEQKVQNLKRGTRIRIESIKTVRSSRQKEVVCSVIQPGEWYKIVNYADCSLYSTISQNKCIRVLDVKEIPVKGDKRKLALTDSGIFRFNKRSKLEKEIRVGDFL